MPEEINKVTYRVKVVGIRPDLYTLYICVNLDQPVDSDYRYITVTKCPNWQGYSPQIGEEGFIQVEYAEAGKTYYNNNAADYFVYRFTAYYFMSFVKDEKKMIDTKEYNL